MTYGGNPEEPGKEPDVIFKMGQVDKNQQIEGFGVLQMVNEKVSYSGDCQENMFEGHGKIEYLETGNTFEGRVEKDTKHGPAIFRLKTGETYSGILQYNIAKAEKDDFGSRK